MKYLSLTGLLAVALAMAPVSFGQDCSNPNLTVGERIALGRTLTFHPTASCGLLGLVGPYGSGGCTVHSQTENQFGEFRNIRVRKTGDTLTSVYSIPNYQSTAYNGSWSNWKKPQVYTGPYTPPPSNSFVMGSDSYTYTPEGAVFRATPPPTGSDEYYYLDGLKRGFFLDDECGLLPGTSLWLGPIVEPVARAVYDGQFLKVNVNSPACMPTQVLYVYFDKKTKFYWNFDANMNFISAMNKGHPGANEYLIGDQVFNMIQGDSKGLVGWATTCLMLSNGPLGTVEIVQGSPPSNPGGDVLPTPTPLPPSLKVTPTACSTTVEASVTGLSSPESTSYQFGIRDTIGTTVWTSLTQTTAPSIGPINLTTLFGPVLGTKGFIAGTAYTIYFSSKSETATAPTVTQTQFTFPSSACSTIALNNAHPICGDAITATVSSTDQKNLKVTWALYRLDASGGRILPAISQGSRNANAGSDTLISIISPTASSIWSALGMTAAQNGFELAASGIDPISGRSVTFAPIRFSFAPISTKISARMSPASVTSQWLGSPSPGTFKFQVQDIIDFEATGAAGARPVSTEWILNGADTPQSQQNPAPGSWVIPVPPPGAPIKVRAVYQNGCLSEASATAIVDLRQKYTPPVVPCATKEATIRMYPNPVIPGQPVTVDSRGIYTEQAEIDLVDMKGARLKTWTRPMYSDGKFQLAVPAALASGMVVFHFRFPKCYVESFKAIKVIVQ